MAPRKAPETQPTRRSGRIEAAKVIQQAILDDQVSIVSFLENHVHTDAIQRSKVTKPKRFRRPQQRKRCLLLNKLPGEIRNMIWHYAVVQNPITVTSSGPGEPGLLRASRQIRRETRAMYYSANEFIVEVMDYDGAALTPWSRQHYRYANAESCCKILMLGEPDWGNLMRWCKDVAQTPCALIPALEQKKPKCDCGQHNHYPDDDVAEGMIRIADELRWNLGWASVEKVLEGAHQAVTARNRDWA